MSGGEGIGRTGAKGAKGADMGEGECNGRAAEGAGIGTWPALRESSAA